MTVQKFHDQIYQMFTKHFWHYIIIQTKKSQENSRLHFRPLTKGANILFRIKVLNFGGQGMYLKYWRPQGLIADRAVEDL